MAEETSGKPRFRFRLSRPMMIVIGVLLVLVVIVVVLVIILNSSPAAPPAQVADKAAPETVPVLPLVTTAPTGTAGMSLTVAPSATAVPPAATALPTAVPPTAAPPATQQVAVVPAGPTEIPAATPRTTVGGAGTTQGVGGEQPMPETSSGWPWLIPVGVVLVVAVLWWRWRRAHAPD